ncbi:MAG: hypothetical protein HOV67_34760, partial [Kribbellaceae bacterium]|nr:hypothetical protein [Kribbellaceae bacterium]
GSGAEAEEILPEEFDEDDLPEELRDADDADDAEDSVDADELPEELRDAEDDPKK